MLTGPLYTTVSPSPLGSARLGRARGGHSSVALCRGSPRAGVTDHAATWHAPATATTSEDAYEITNCGCLASRLPGGVAVARPATGGGAAGERLGTSPVAWTARYTMRA